MAQDRFKQGTGSWERRRLGLGLLFLLCLLTPALAVPPDSSAQPKAAQPSPKPSPKELLSKARKLEAKKQYAEAAEVYGEYLAIRPKDDEIRFILARLLAQQGKQAEAAELYETILSRAPRNLAVRQELADALFKNGQYALALQHYETLYAATKDPAVADQIKKVKEALASPSQPAPGPLEAPVAPTPIPLPPEGTLERARALEAAQQHSDAVEAYEKYLKVHPDDEEAHRSFARLLFSQGQYSEATAAYQTILSRHPSDIDALVALGNIAAREKKISDARWYYEAALRTDPSNIEAKRGLADFYYWYRNQLLALRYYEEVFRATQDPAIGQRIQEILAQQVTSPRAPVGAIQEKPILPFRDYLKFGYSHYTYTQNIPDERDALLEIAMPFEEITVVARVERLNRFGRTNIPLSAEISTPLWRKAWGNVTFGAAASPSFVPNYRIGMQIFQDLGMLHQSLSILEASFGYERLTYFYRAHTSPTLFIPAQDVDVMTPSLTMYLPFNVWLTEKLYFVPQTGSITLSTRLTWRPTDRVELFASGGFGTSGEKIYAFQDFTRADTRTIQGGAIFPITKQLSGEFAGFYEDRGFLYIRRGGTFNLIWHW